MTERYIPAPTNGQLATTPCGGSNCLVWSSARAVEYDSRGGIAAITGAIRRWISGTTCGGTTLAQVAAAVKSLYGVELSVRYQVPWADFVTLITAGHGAAIYIGYAAMHGSGFDAFPTFNGGHGVDVFDVRSGAGGREFLVFDPGADGRRAEIPDGIPNGQWWPEALLKKAAGAMPTNGGTVGFGFVSAAFTRDTEDEEVGETMFEIARGSVFPQIAAIGQKALRVAPSDTAAVYHEITAAEDTFRTPYVGSVQGNEDWRIVVFAEPAEKHGLTGSPVLFGVYIRQRDIWKFEDAPVPPAPADTAAAEKLAADAVANAAAAEAAKYGG